MYSSACGQFSHPDVFLFPGICCPAFLFACTKSGASLTTVSSFLPAPEVAPRWKQTDVRISQPERSEWSGDRRGGVKATVLREISVGF